MKVKKCEVTFNIQSIVIEADKISVNVDDRTIRMKHFDVLDLIYSDSFRSMFALSVDTLFVLSLQEYRW